MSIKDINQRIQKVRWCGLKNEHNFCIFVNHILMISTLLVLIIFHREVLFTSKWSQQLVQQRIGPSEMSGFGLKYAQKFSNMDKNTFFNFYFPSVFLNN